MKINSLNVPIIFQNREFSVDTDIDKYNLLKDNLTLYYLQLSFSLPHFTSN